MRDTGGRRSGGRPGQLVEEVAELGEEVVDFPGRQ